MMSNGIPKLIVLSLFTLHVAAAQDANVLTLDEAIAIGKEHSRMLKIADAKAEQARARANEANTTLLPSLKLTGSYQRLSDVPDFAVTLPSSLPPPLGGSSVTLAPTVLNTYNARVSLQQPIFTGFKLRSNAKAAEYLADASQFDRNDERSDLVLTVTTAYWALYQTMETKRFMDENVTRLRSFVNDTKNLLNAGLVTKNDLLKVSLQLNNAILSQIDATNDVQLAMMALNNVLGQPLDTQLRLASKPAGPGARGADSMNTGSSAVMQAIGSRADLQAMQSRVEAAKAGVTAARGNWWPQLFLVGGYTYARPNQRYQPTLDEFKGTWDVGVQLQFDLWNWGATSDQTEQASAQLKQSELAFEQMKENVSFDVKHQQLASEQSREKVSVAMLAIDQAEENQRTTDDKYKQGLVTASDLLDANVALLQAKMNYSGALVEHEIAIARLHKAIGVEQN
jgi:outer membrane protein